MYKLLYLAAANLIILGVVILNLPEKIKTVEVVRFVDYVEQIEVPREPTWEEKVEAIQITIDGTYKANKRRALTDIKTPPVPEGKAFETIKQHIEGIK